LVWVFALSKQNENKKNKKNKKIKIYIKQGWEPIHKKYKLDKCMRI
jgi:hypothetical protein